MYVSCGHCPACQQHKASLRSLRIRNNTFLGERAFFVTLTYKPEFMPYFKHEELVFGKCVRYKATRHDEDLKEVILPYAYHRVPIYRNAFVSKKRCSADYKTKFITTHKKHKIGYFDVPVDRIGNEIDINEDGVYDWLMHPAQFKTPTNGESGTISLSFYKDVQNYIKRLRINLQRKYDYKTPLRYFSCSEYGTATHRCHFHLLIWVNSTLSDSMWKDILCEAWPYADYKRTRENIKVAVSAAAYVSSYVNSSTYLPPLFTTIKEISPRHSYSHIFGLAKDEFTLPAIKEKIYSGDLRYDCKVVRKGASIDGHIVLPKYVISRQFPKFKGYCRLATHEIEYVCRRPEKIADFAERLELDGTDIHSITVCLYNRLASALRQGITPDEYAFLHSRVWPLFYANSLADSAAEIKDVKDVFERYDNINEFFDGKVHDSSLDEILRQKKCLLSLETDCNRFRRNMIEHNRLEQMYHKYDKSRHIRNYIYSDLHGDC